MRLSSLFLIFKRKVCFVPLINRNFKINNLYRCVNVRNQWIATTVSRKVKIIEHGNGSDDEIDLEYEYPKTDTDQTYTRDLLFKDSKDLLLSRISDCVSVQELFNVLNKNTCSYSYQHITQTILVLYDLKRIHDEMNSTSSSSAFIVNLAKNSSFQMLLMLINEKIDSFDVNTLSYLLLYLNKLGLSMETPIFHTLSEALESKLLKNFNISAASRFLEVIFREFNLKAYFASQNVVPLVFNEIDICNSPDSLHDLSISLNKLHNVVTEDLLEQYRQKVEAFIENGVITSEHYKAILQVIAFLNYPKWREQNSVLISKCILLIKSNLNALNLNEVILLFEIFFKIQGPGEILNELQRCSSRYFHQMDDALTPQKIALFTTVLYFTSPHVRIGFEEILKKYVQECTDFNNLILLRKLLSYIKISDVNLCQLYWNKMLKYLRLQNKSVDLIKLSQNYMHFNMDMDNYRHKEFEMELLKLFEMLIQEVSYKYFPQKLAIVLSFVLIYGENTTLLEDLVTNLETNWSQLRPVECLKLCISLRLFNAMDKKYTKLQYAKRIDKVINKFIEKEVNISDNLWTNNVLLKSCVYKENVNTTTLNKLLTNYSSFSYISSKNVENIYYCFLNTNTLIPKVFDNMVDYVVNYKDHVLGFNVSKIVYLCYCLSYFPKNSHNFFNIATNVMIRDQERLSGLSLIYCALALCFFNKLPNSLIKSIFNVEFMDKLDKELQTCYSKDKYPQRVRNNLMQLNRAVCLDYPECNVPWFHQKYIDEHITNRNKRRGVFGNKVKETLIKIVQDQDIIEENVVTPYGYEIDFVINFSEDSVEPSERCRLALILLPDYAYTRIVVQLKSGFQLKKRHLEMLGYKVILINYSDWFSLFYPEDRTDFLTNAIWTNRNNLNITNIR